MARFPKQAAATDTLTTEQKAMMEELRQMFDPCAPVSAQSPEYAELAKKFNATLSDNQKSLARAI